MSDLVKKFSNEYRSIHLKLELSDETPTVSIKSIFVVLTRELDLSLKINRGQELVEDPKALNIVVIEDKKTYEKYLGFDAIQSGLKENVYIVMLIDDSNQHEVTYLPRLDFFITPTFSKDEIQKKVLKAYQSKKNRILNYQDQILAEHYLNEQNYTQAQKCIKQINKRTTDIDSLTLVLESRVYEGLDKNDEAFKILHDHLDEEHPNYYLLTQMYVLLSRSRLHDHAFDILAALLNHFQVEKDTLSLAVGNAIKYKRYFEIQTILDYIIKQDKSYKAHLKHFLEVTFYIYIKHLYLSQKTKKLKIYLEKMIRHIPESSSYTKMAQLAASKKQLSSFTVISNVFKDSQKLNKYHTLIEILTNSNSMSASQIINRSKELIDYDHIKIKELYDIFIDALEYVGMEKEIDHYMKKYKHYFRGVQS